MGIARQLDDNTWYDGLYLRRGQMPGLVPVKRDANTLYRNEWVGHLGVAPLPSAVSAVPSPYATNPAVFSAVNALSWRVAQADIKLLRRRETEDEEQPDHEAMRLLENPNPYQTKLHLKWHVVADMKLNGNAYWFLAGPNRGAPKEIWRMYPRNVQIVRGRDEYITGYVYDVDGVQVPLDVNEVIHFPNPNPLDWYGYGFPELLVASLPAETARKMAEWNRSLFSENNAVPAGVLSIRDMISDEDYERIKVEWRKSYGGTERKTAFIRGGLAEFQPIGLSQTDMEFNTGQRFTAEEIHMIFGTAHLLPGLSAEDRKANERIFLEGYVQPLLDFFCEVLSDQLITYWDKPGVYRFEPEDVSPRDKALEMEDTRLRRPLLTFNEARADEGLEPVDGGDDILAVHVEQGEKVQFELDAMPEPEPQPIPPQFQQPPDQPPPADEPPDNGAQTADENAAEREGSGDDTGEDIAGFANRSLPPASLLPFITNELRAWRTYVVKRLGQGDSRQFTPEYIPAFLAGHMGEALANCQTVEAVKALFSEALEAVYDSEPSYEVGVPDERPDVAIYRALIGDELEGDTYELRHYTTGKVYAGRALKVYSLTAANYRASLLQIVAQAADRESIRRTGQPALDKRTFRLNGRRAIDIHFNAAFTDGLGDGGVVTFELDPEETQAIAAQVDQEQAYWNGFSDEVYSTIVPLVRELAAVEDDLRLSGLNEADRAGLRKQLGDLTRRIVAKTAEFTRRIDLWVNKGLNRIYELGKLSAKSNQMLQWHLGATEQHCRSCLAANGQRHRARDWMRSGIMPQADTLECGGFYCDCSLMPTTEAATGQLARIPRKDWTDAEYIAEALAVKTETGDLPAWARQDGDTITLVEFDHDHDHEDSE